MYKMHEKIEKSLNWVWENWLLSEENHNIRGKLITCMKTHLQNFKLRVNQKLSSRSGYVNGQF